MKTNYIQLLKNKELNKKSFAVLIDPDKINNEILLQIIGISNKCKVDYFFIGGSLVTSQHIDEYIKIIKANSSIPVFLFPGSPAQVSVFADSLLYLSLISGRNPELLIGQHVLHAPFIKNAGLEIIPTGYILIDGGTPTSVSYISNTNPIPANKKDIATCTAMAGEMLGLKLIYMDAGSGALNPITASIIQAVSTNIQIPLIVGGGINSVEKLLNAANAGADVVVVGNAIEKNNQLIYDLTKALFALNNP